MVRYRILIFLFLGFQFPSILFSLERNDLIIKKNTTVLLSSIAKPNFKKDSGVPSYDLNYLHLGEGAKLYIDSPVSLNAKKMVLKPTSGIFTLGHSMTIKTDEWVATDFGIDFSPLATESEKIARMGRIDTQARNPQGMTGLDGGAGGAGKDAGKNLDHISPPNAGPGVEGYIGQDGGNGKDAGSVTLIVKSFSGGYFVSVGGNGGNGGSGGLGGNGGAGYSDTRGKDYREDLLRGSSFLKGGSGNNGGNGGRGGSGGKGGAVIVHYETKIPHADSWSLVCNVGGAAGEGGEGGRGGQGGPAGTVLSSRYGHSEIPVPRLGERGSDGAMGHRGANGIAGLPGPTLRLEQVAYETEN